MTRLTSMGRHRVMKAVLGITLLASFAWGAVELTRSEPVSVMPVVRPGVTAPPGATTTTGMAAIGIVSVRQGVQPRILIVNLAACHAMKNAVDIAEDQGRVLLYARTTGGTEGFCSDGVTESLGQELGKRTVVDGNSGQPVRIQPE